MRVNGATVRDEPRGSGPSCRAILDRLPTWFGVAAANDDYVAVADTSPCILVAVDGIDVGILNLRHHTPYSSEVYLMAVMPEFHRQGIGRAMLRHAETQLRRAGVEFLQVKTLSSRHPDEGYAKTRAFYESYGFRPLEEFPDLWSNDNPALQMIKTVDA